MSEPPSQPHWPAVIQYQGEDELLYLADAADWQAQAGAQHVPFAGQDRLIDSLGRTYRLRTDAAGDTLLEPMDQPMDLAGFTTLLRAHAVSVGSCCAGKVGCNDLAEGMRLIGQLEDD